MNCAVNLLPDSCHNVRRRTNRRNAWVVVLLSAGLLVAGTWVALRATDRAIGRLSREFSSVQIQQTELDRRLMFVTVARNKLAERARALTALHQEQTLPGQLLTLTSLAPEGVVLTEIRTPSPGDTRRPARSPAEASRAGTQKTATRDTTPIRNPVTVQMRGCAVNHDELTRLIDALQNVPRWEQVELLRTAREPYRTGVALTFHLECRRMEGAP